MNKYIDTITAGARLDVDHYINDGAGIAWQADLTNTMDYGEEYFYEYVRRSDTDVGMALNLARAKYIIQRNPSNRVLDIGIGSGALLAALWQRGTTYLRGYDINPFGISWLLDRGLFYSIERKSIDDFGMITFFDSMEHIPDPCALVSRVPGDIIISIPLMQDFSRLLTNKHFKPREHLYYFTPDGIERYFSYHGFEVLDRANFEILIGREAIYTYHFRRKK